jgi:hypothetical protein
VSVPYRFGRAIAASGEWLVVGAPGEDAASVLNAGAAYVYRFNGSVYELDSPLNAADAGNNDEFGSALAIDGDVIVIGAPEDDLPSGSGAGSAYVFERSGSIWQQRAKLVAPDGRTADLFGASVAISGDLVVVGAPYDDIDGIGVNVGSAHVFERTGGTWNHALTLLASDAGTNHRFARSVAVSGNRVLVGAPEVEQGAGAVYAYRFEGLIAPFEGRLVADDRSEFDAFGTALSMDGTTILIGASQRNAVVGENVGAGYVFTRLGSQWTQKARLTVPDPQVGERLGLSVALHGGMALLGAPYTQAGDCCQQGSARLFLGTADAWQYLRRVPIPEAAPYDRSGFAVALVEAGPLLGAPDSNDPASAADATGSVVLGEIGLSLFRDDFDPGTP